MSAITFKRYEIWASMPIGYQVVATVDPGYTVAECGYERFPRTYPLSEDEMQFYKENGYLIINGLIDQATINNLRKRFSDICHNRVPRGGVAKIKDIDLLETKSNPEDYINKLNFVHSDEVFCEQVEHPRLLHVLTQLLGYHITVMNAMLINKPPHTPWHPPHQDMYYIPLTPWDKVLTTWTALDSVTQDNGCLFVIPGSHKPNLMYEEEHLKGFVKHMYFTIKDPDRVAPVSQRVSLAPLEPGDTVIMNSMLVHGSWPNNSTLHRKAITNVYASNECRFVDPTGTVQEPFAKEITKTMKEYGLDISLQDYWEIKSRIVQGLRCNL